MTFIVLLHGARNLFLSLDSPTLGGLCGCAMSERDDDDEGGSSQVHRGLGRHFEPTNPSLWI